MKMTGRKMYWGVATKDFAPYFGVHAKKKDAQAVVDQFRSGVYRVVRVELIWGTCAGFKSGLGQGER